jgi:hypothetical protein
MRSFDHVKQMVIALALGLSLASCDSLSDLENMFNNKKPLPGERKPVFSDGVPGVPQGIPPELVRGYQAPVDAQQPAAVTTPTEKPVAEPAEKPKPKPKPRPTTVAVPAGPPATTITVGPKGSNTPAAGASAWPTPPAAGQQPPQQQANPSPPQWPPSSAQSAPPAPSPWPAAPPPGTFSR